MVVVLLDRHENAERSQFENRRYDHARTRFAADGFVGSAADQSQFADSLGSVALLTPISQPRDACNPPDGSLLCLIATKTRNEANLKTVDMIIAGQGLRPMASFLGHGTNPIDVAVPHRLEVPESETMLPPTVLLN